MLVVIEYMADLLCLKSKSGVQYLVNCCKKQALISRQHHSLGCFEIAATHPATTTCTASLNSSIVLTPESYHEAEGKKFYSLSSLDSSVVSV
jgi:hypothetical protein